MHDWELFCEDNLHERLRGKNSLEDTQVPAGANEQKE